MPDRRQSRKRDAILNLIRSSKNHPGAQWVYGFLKSEFPDLSLGTVYRNIKVLIEEGSLASIGVIHGEERFDGDLQPHAHAICTGCGMILDLPAYNWQAEIPDHGIEIQKVVFYGICDGCKSGRLYSAGSSKETAAFGR